MALISDQPPPYPGINPMNILQSFVASLDHGFLTEAQARQLQNLDRLFPVLVRCGSARFTCPVQDLPTLIRMVRLSGDHVRDVSIPTGSEARIAAWHAPTPQPSPHARIRENLHYIYSNPDALYPPGWITEVLNEAKALHVSFDESQCAGTWDGFHVGSDADPGL